jgi:opacity protein-like surface antigen
MKAIIVSLLVASSIQVGAAAAADLGGPSQPAFEEPQQSSVLPTHRFYVRGDVGVSRFSTSGFSQQQLTDNTGSFLTSAMGDSADIGVGIGWQVSNRFRIDLTADYLSKASIRGLDYLSVDLDNPYGHLTGSSLYEGDFSSAVGLVNGYWDIGKWRDFTPYVGAGIGIARNQVTGLVTSQTSTFVEDGTGDITLFNANGMGENHAKYSLAWALMAGTSYDLGSNAKLDLGYRYLNLGSGASVSTGLINCTCGTISDPLKLHDITAQEVRFGIRWELDAPVHAIDHEPMK